MTRRADDSGAWEKALTRERREGETGNGRVHSGKRAAGWATLIFGAGIGSGGLLSAEDVRLWVRETLSLPPKATVESELRGSLRDCEIDNSTFWCVRRGGEYGACREKAILRWERENP